MSGTAFRAPRPHLKRTERSLHPAPSLKGAPRLLGRPLVVRGVAPAPLQVGLKGAPRLQVGLEEEETPPTPSWTRRGRDAPHSKLDSRAPPQRGRGRWGGWGADGRTPEAVLDMVAELSVPSVFGFRAPPLRNPSAFPWSRIRRLAGSSFPKGAALEGSLGSPRLPAIS